jgi:hypothetical protein
MPLFSKNNRAKNFDCLESVLSPPRRVKFKNSSKNLNIWAYIYIYSFTKLEYL